MQGFIEVHLHCDNGTFEKSLLNVQRILAMRQRNDGCTEIWLDIFASGNVKRIRAVTFFAKDSYEEILKKIRASV